MSLSVESRWCGRVFVIRCVGRIITGQESQLESTVNRGLLDSNRMVLNVAEVARVDSTGMGLLVRFHASVTSRGGDIRLAAAQPFFRTLLDMTKLSSLFRMYDSEEEAIVSFLHEPGGMSAGATAAGPLVLFLDQSADLCAFIRRLLNGHGYQVLSTCRLHDAKLLLSASKFSYVVLGPECSQSGADAAQAALTPFAKSASVVRLESGFHLHDADHAGSELLRRLQAAAAGA